MEQQKMWHKILGQQIDNEWETDRLGIEFNA